MKSFAKKFACCFMIFCGVCIVIIIWNIKTSYPQKEYVMFIETSGNGSVNPRQLLSGQSTARLNKASNPKKEYVMFMETSGKGTLNLRQLVSVESAARFITGKQVVVFIFTEKKQESTLAMKDLERIYDVVFVKTDLPTFITDTPLERWYKEGLWKKASYTYAVSHTSDGLRYLVLQKYGGVYADLDVIFKKEWTVPGNVLVWETKDSFGSSVLAFKKGAPFVSKCLEEFCDNYNPYDWSANGPHLITRIYNNNNLKEVLDIKNINMLSKTSFFEIGYIEEYKIFNTTFTLEVLKRTSNSTGVHFWNKLSNHFRVPWNSTCAFLQLTKMSAPVIYQHVIKSGYI